MSKTRPYPPRPGYCMSKACVDGYIRSPDWEQGRYVWRECAHPVHDEELTNSEEK